MMSDNDNLNNLDNQEANSPNGTKKKARKARAEGDGGEKVHKPNWRETHLTPEDIQRFLCDNVLLRYNVITSEPEFRVPERDEFEAMGMKYPTGAVPLDEWRSATEWYGVCDRFVTSLYNMLSVGKEVREQDIWRVIKSDFVPLYNPFRQYLSRLPPWNGETNPILELAMTALGFKGVRSHGQRGYNVVAYTDDERKANKSMLAYDAKPELEASMVTMDEIRDTFDTLF